MKRVLAAALLCACATPAPVEKPAPPVAQATPPPPQQPWVRKAPPPPLAARAVTPPSVTRHKLENGLRVVIVEDTRRPVVTLSFVFPHGALSDPPLGAGMTAMAVELASDFYESMGVNDREDNERSFRRRVLDLGGISTFDVTPDDSLVRIAGYSRDTLAYLAVMEDAVRKLRHGARSFSARRAATLDALDELESEDPQALQQLVEASAFGEGHPYARPVIGNTQSLNEMELQEVMDHQHLVFSPAGATLLVVGDVRPKEVIAKVTALFENWDGGDAPVPAVPRPSLPKRGGDVGFLERHAASTLFTCATRPLPEVAGNNAALRVLVAAFGQGLGSRLGRALREDNGLTYGANAEIVRRRQASALVACSALQGASAAKGVRLFREVVESMRATPLADAELKRAKALVAGELESSWDDVESITGTWLTALTVGDGTPHPERERAELERVSAKDVQKLARALFRVDSFRWLASGERKTATAAFDKLGRLHAFVKDSE